MLKCDNLKVIGFIIQTLGDFSQDQEVPQNHFWTGLSLPHVLVPNVEPETLEKPLQGKVLDF